MTTQAFVGVDPFASAVGLIEDKAEAIQKRIARFKRDDMNNALAQTILQLMSVVVAMLLMVAMPTVQIACWAAGSVLLQLVVVGDGWFRLIMLDDEREPSTFRRFAFCGVQVLSVFAGLIGLALAMVHVLLTL